jgi:UMF1 family MFS transporter
VILFASNFAEREVKFSIEENIVFFLILQVSASVGAFFFGFIQDRLGAKTSIQISLSIWLAVCVGAYFTHTKPVFYVVGNFAGLAMGAAQSAGRALVGSFSPVERTGEFFGFWGLFWKSSSVVGPYLFGWCSKGYGMRSAILLTGGFFLTGVIGMCFVNEKEGRLAALSGPLPSGTG